VRWFVSLWLPLAGAKPVEDPELLIWIKEVFVSLAELLEAGRTVFVHCSAGIHRTGMITNGFLRFLGHDASEAADLLNRMRPVLWRRHRRSSRLGRPVRYQ